MFKPRSSLFALLLSLLAVSFFGAACSSPAEQDNDGRNQANANAGDAVDDGDVEDDIDDGSCAYQEDCGEGEYCFEGACHKARKCAEPKQWERCTDAFAEIDESLAKRAYCDGTYCQIACLVDEECPEGKTCSDHGSCIPFTGELTGIHPGGDEPAPLKAGVGNALMHFPIGLSQGGYGSRLQINGGRFVESLQPTTGTMHGLYVRGIAIDDGTRQLMFLRAPIIFPSMALQEAVARNLQEETGRDWRSSLVISGTHTHSGPARFWHLPDPYYTRLPMGVLGIDQFHQQAFDWLVQSFTDAALEALDDLAPAKMGWTIVEAFDTDDLIASNRWSQIPSFDDNRALVLRVDDLDDKPRALLVSLGIHGTIHSGSYFTGDVMTGIERQLEQALFEEYGVYAPVALFNQNGGNMSPRGDRYGHRESQKFEVVGYDLVQKIFADITTMDTTSDWSFRAHTHRFPLKFDYMGYQGREFSHPDERTDEGRYFFGGLMCEYHSEEGYEHHADPEESKCVGIHELHFHRPISLFAKSQITAMQLNDLTIITMPGELTMPLGWELQRDLRDAYDIDPFKSFTWGYAQDHLLYLTPTNLRGERPPFPGISLPPGMAPDDYPDYTFSTLQGGYESEMNPWGYRLGEFLLARAVEAMGILLGEEVELEFPVSYPEEYSRIDSPEFPIETSDPAQVGVLVEQPPVQVERRQAFHIAWRGGDPLAEMPQAPLVTLERAVGDDFEAVLNRNGALYTNREFLMPTRMRQSEDGHWEWAAYFEEMKDFPAGTYRFRINGHYFVEASTDPIPYESFSDTFEIVPSTALVVSELQVLDEQTISLRLSYPAAESPTIGGPSSDPGFPKGSFRMHHPRVASGLLIPVDAEADYESLVATVTAGGDELAISEVVATTNNENIDGRSNLPVTRVELRFAEDLPTGELEIQIEATDKYGNSGSYSDMINR